MLRNTKHLIHACLLLFALGFLTPSANAQQLPGPINNNLQVAAYEVQGFPAPPVMYVPGISNTLEIWGQNYANAPIAVDVGVWIDLNNDGTYAATELVFSTGSPMLLPASTVNNGVNSVTGATTIIMPNLPPGNIDTRIEFFTASSPLIPNTGLARVDLGGGSSSDLTLTASVQDDPNYIIPIVPQDCPMDQMIEMVATGTSNGNVVINGVHSPHPLTMKVYDLNNVNTNVPFTLVRHVVAIDPNTSLPQALDPSLIIPRSEYFSSNSQGQAIEHNDPLRFVYWPIGTMEFEVHYYLEDQNGTPILIQNANSQVGPFSAFQSWSTMLCPGREYTNPNLSELYESIIDGDIVIEYGAGGEGGRQAFLPSPADEFPATIFPNPSTGMSYLQ
ncbi:MAG: hypothetical protein AAFQ68_00460, partial [Bacteroidota bacterium]